MIIRRMQVESTEDVTRSGVIWARFVDSDLDQELSEPVVYTSPSISVPTGHEEHKFTGITALPGELSYILVCKSTDDNRWYYISTISNPAVDASKNANSNPPTTGSPEGEFRASLPTQENRHAGTYALSPKPTKLTIDSPGGGSFQISDSAAPDVLNYYTKMHSMTRKKVIANDVDDHISMSNEHGDGIKVTSSKCRPKGPNPGVRSVALQAKGNVFVESNEGNLDMDVLGGAQLNLRNKSLNTKSTRPEDSDTMTGELNIGSYGNSVNIYTLGKGEDDSEPKGIFIDASGFRGVVQIRAGTGGVEVWSDGEIDFNCQGNFNINAGGEVNIKGDTINLNPDNTFGKDTLTKNNEEQYLEQNS